MKTAFLTVLALGMLSAPAFAQITWDQPGSGGSVTTMTTTTTTSGGTYGQTKNYERTPSTTVTYHENLNYEGNATLKKTDIKKLQKALAARGFYKGKIDGLWGGQTSQAILDFQGATNQALTGTVTAETLQDLGVTIDSSRY